MIIAIGNDHHGFEQKNFIKKHLTFSDKTIEWLDVGSNGSERVDYPSHGIAVAKAVQKGQVNYGVLLCGSGVGMSIVANRFNGIYAALAWNQELACKSKEEDKANILVIPSDYVSNEEAVTMINIWLTASFKGGRYQTRIDMIDEIGGV